MRSIHTSIEGVTAFYIPIVEKWKHNLPNKCIENANCIHRRRKKERIQFLNTMRWNFDFDEAKESQFAEFRLFLLFSLWIS